MANRSRLRSAKPTRTDPPGSVWVAGRSVAERRVDGEGRGSRAEAPPGSERRRKVRSRERTIGARRRIEGKRTTSSLSIKSEFARATGDEIRSRSEQMSRLTAGKYGHSSPCEGMCCGPTRPIKLDHRFNPRCEV